MTGIRTQGTAWGLLVVRVMLGSTFILHGAQKVFGVFGGPGLTNFANGVAERQGMPVILGYLAALFEFVGGWMVLLGVGAEIGALMLVPVMLVAVVKVHLANGYFLSNQGFEYAFNLLLASIAVILAGPGAWALWDPFGRWRRQMTDRPQAGSEREAGQASESQ